MMSDYNFYVVAELRDDLSEKERQKANQIITDSMKRMDVEKENPITFRKSAPIIDFDDFGGISTFYCMLEDAKHYFKRLAFYDVEEGVKDIAV